MVAAGVVAQAAGAGDVAEGAEVGGLLRGQHGGAGEPVAHDAVAEGEVDDLGDVGGERGQLVGVRAAADGGAAGEDRAAQQPVAGDPVVERGAVVRGCAGRGR